jgi:hypothetical protein
VRYPARGKLLEAGHLELLLGQGLSLLLEMVTVGREIVLCLFQARSQLVRSGLPALQLQSQF